MAAYAASCGGRTFRGLPQWMPCAFARAMPALTLCAISAFSNSAKLVMMLNINSPTGLVPEVSSHCSM